eukprot:CAMPEP_0204645154 /NCGR_PEP_ID=MMETSP0718-20130828/1978_1 /ASSEMBLY_ACC=CAM_ASM_000674 /TAXON_ID=230516 /ORGANISM="Chaetoceros curvisetus" /LENGTH=154 /DNA_ID=CAMNT_0051666917 /DNA_START=63 /DNA_END=527 /DNA_ORIENTATION=-
MPITRKVQSSLLLLFIFLMAQSNHAQVTTPGTRARRLLGGYSQVDTDNLQVIQGAKAVVESLRKGGGEDISIDLPKTSDGGDLRIKVLEASSQVVAGMNFKMKIAVFAGEQCIGGLSPIVFRDLQGTYSVTSYGEDIPCETVREMLGSNEEEDE